MAKLSNRLVRLLNLVPYLQTHPGVRPEKAAADLGVSKKQLIADLNTLWVGCGLPGHGPGDLIDLEITDDYLGVTFSAGMDRPLRLTSIEAAVVQVALRQLTELPGLVDPEAARTASAKIEAATSSVGAASGPPVTPAPSETPAVAAVRDAVNRHRALAIDYFSASRDTSSHRVVDPIRVAALSDQSYLEAWCRSAEGVRLFRFDRIDSAEVLDESSSPPVPAVQAGTDTALFEGDESFPSATLRVAPSAAWMFDYYPMRLLGESADGYTEVAMTYASDEWMTRLLLGLGSQVQVLAPESLVARVREAADAAVAAYQQSGA
ncbi:MAG TPA: YafY family protein [Mycobacterium sp.]|nr:YafY family protein [Mycobacterium sp.]